MIDKDLFQHNLSIVAILKNEGHYLKEWLDYHLLAGVDHFYLYDNDSSDNQLEVAKPYIATGLVDYFSISGKAMQYLAYTDAIRKFRFFTRYMAFIDGDEFIFPKNSKGTGGISEIVDEAFSLNSRAAGLGINWQIYGSDGQENADYSRGVLERFTRRAPKDWVVSLPANNNLPGGNAHIKTVANPRMIYCMMNPHFPKYFGDFCNVNENGKELEMHFNDPVTVEKIAVNHYNTKSHEEYGKKHARGAADRFTDDNYLDDDFKLHDRNEEFDDAILKYREEQLKVFQIPEISRPNEKLFDALTKNLSPTFFSNAPQKVYSNKVETFLTCRAVASYLQKKITDPSAAKIFEEAAIKALLKSLQDTPFYNTQIFLSELPELLKLSYPVISEVRANARSIVLQIRNFLHQSNNLVDFVRWNYLYELLKE